MPVCPKCGAERPTDDSVCASCASLAASHSLWRQAPGIGVLLGFAGVVTGLVAACVQSIFTLNFGQGNVSKVIVFGAQLATAAVCYLLYSVSNRGSLRGFRPFVLGFVIVWFGAFAICSSGAYLQTAPPHR